MSTTIRPDNLKAALDAKLAAASSRLVELREADQPRVTLHLNARQIVGALITYLRDIYRIADGFGKAQAGDLQFNTWYEQWTATLNDIDRTLWRHLRGDRVQADHGQGADLVDVEISVPSDPAITIRESSPGAAQVRKQLVRFAAYPNRAASDICDHYLRIAKRFAHDFVRDHERFLPSGADTAE